MLSLSLSLLLFHRRHIIVTRKREKKKGVQNSFEKKKLLLLLLLLLEERKKKKKKKVSRLLKVERENSLPKITLFIRAQIRKKNTSVFVMKQVHHNAQQQVHHKSQIKAVSYTHLTLPTILRV